MRAVIRPRILNARLPPLDSDLGPWSWGVAHCHAHLAAVVNSGSRVGVGDLAVAFLDEVPVTGHVDLETVKVVS